MGLIAKYRHNKVRIIILAILVKILMVMLATCFYGTFEILAAVSIKITVVWNVILLS
jgi:hypothetical protein